MKKSFISFIMLLAIGTQVVAQNSAIKKIIEMGTTDNQVMRHLGGMFHLFLVLTVHPMGKPVESVSLQAEGHGQIEIGRPQFGGYLFVQSFL